MDNGTAKSKILIIDDEKANIIALSHMLGSEYEIFVSKNGQKGIEHAQTHLPDLILLDIIMPDMDGYDVMLKIKSMPEIRDIPVIFITGLTNNANEEKGLAMGAADYITKPFQPLIVKLRVENQLKMLRQLKAIERLSMIDQLTGLHNRRSFEARFCAEWGRARREQNAISILMIDVDRFKLYNDTHGHQQGDVVLQEFAKVFDETLKRTSDFCARWGGEEFVALLPATDVQGAIRVAENLRQNVEEMIIPSLYREPDAEWNGSKVTVSIGVNTWIHGDNFTADEFISGADTALYSAKDAGRNKVCHFNDNKSFDIRYSRTATEYEYEIMKYKLTSEALSIALWDMEIIREDPINPRNRFTWSDEFRYMLGYTDENDFPNIFHSWSDLLHPDDKDRTLKAFESHINDHSKKTPYNVEYRLKTKSGEYRYFHAFGNTLRSEEGIPLRVAGALRDITDEKKTAENLRVTSEKLKAALKLAEAGSKAKGDFLSSMSHEMRTPLNAIIGMTTIGANAIDIESKNNAFNKISDASSHLLGVINDILDMAKIEANKLELSPVEYNFDKMLQKVITIVCFRAEKKKQTLSVNIDPDIPRFVIGDDQRLAQVIMNLLSNAMKFTPEGGKIQFNVSLINDSEIRAEIIDDGIGISPKNQKNLFKAFEQVEGGISREFGGTGLGLVISKRIVELMGGKIWVESEIGSGATFVFTVKFKRSEKTPASLLSPNVNWNNVRILAVDDALEVREHFLDTFKRLNIKCDVAADGFEACRIIEESGEYDIYFIDWRMPGMDGISLTKRIKAHNSKQSVVTMVTSEDWAQIKDEAASSGVDKHLTKPLFASMLIECVNECLDNEAHSKGMGYAENEFKGKRILIVEDVEINREILIGFLENTGLSIDCAENGSEALDMIVENPGKYDVVFMDVQMPKMNGLEATRRIREFFNEEHMATTNAVHSTHLPIIAMTANVFKSDVEECIASGMDEHLGKPFNIEKVIETLRKYLNKEPS